MNYIENVEKMFAIWERTTEQVWDIARQALGSMTLNQDQLEKYFRNSIEQELRTRDDSSHMVEEFITQLKNNQLYFQKIMEESLIGAFKSFEAPHLDYFEDLYKK